MPANEEAEDGKSWLDILGKASHKLRTPLQAILGYAEVVSMEIHGPITPEQRQDLEHIKGGVDDLVNMLDNLLDFAALQEGRTELDIRPTPLDPALAEVEGALAGRIDQAGITYSRRPATGRVRVHADPEQLRRIFANLLANAVRFTSRGGRISVECERTGERVAVRIADSGCGIPPDQLDRIFEPFVQAHRYEPGIRQGGSGLGLTVSQRLARAMDGDIVVESTSELGSVFTLMLPACAQDT